jgi:DNA topoisomerase-1
MPRRPANETPERAAARTAGLRYVSDADPGICRKRSGTGFRYVWPDGTSVTDPATLRRIRALAIPPAWTDVWICPIPNGHIQAAGRDAKGRKQYRYHAQWREVRDSDKYERMIEFARALPQLRARITADMGLPGQARDKVLATIVSLLDKTLMRVGNNGYVRENDSYGLTTLRNRHVRVNGEELRFHFKGKSGKTWRLSLRDRRIVRVVRHIEDLPGQHLFQYVDDDGAVRAVDSSDVNEYLRERAGENVSAKDFRTWAGSVLAALALDALGPAQNATQAKSNVRRAVEAVAARLGNTPAVCRKSYVHPKILEAYADSTGPLLGGAMQRRPRSHLPPEEDAVLRLLERRLGGKARSVRRDGVSSRARSKPGAPALVPPAPAIAGAR